MMSIQGITVPIFAEDLKTSSHLLKNAIQISNWLKTQLHILVSEDTFSQINDELKFRKEKGEVSQVTILHKLPGIFTKDLSAEVLRSKSNFLLFELEPEMTKMSLLEASPVPVLLLPKRLLLDQDLFYSLIVPMSGEQRINDALSFAILFGHQVHLPVHLVHVTTPGEHCCCGSQLEISGEQFAHEYFESVEHWIAQGSPYSTQREKQVVQSFLHRFGDVSHELLDVMNSMDKGILLLEWKGTFSEGHAETLKRLLHEANFPILLVKNEVPNLNHLPPKRGILRLGKNLVDR